MDEHDEDPLMNLTGDEQVDLLAVVEGLRRGLLVWARAAAEEGQLGAMLAAFFSGDGFFLHNPYRVTFAVERPVTGEMVPDTPEGLE